MTMGLNKRMCQSMVLLLLVLVSQEGLVLKVEAGRKVRMCESQSHLFTGQCWSNKNCANICKSEGFHGGLCRGLRKRCFCTKPCPP